MALAKFLSFFVVYKNINMLLHDLLWIPIIMPSLTPVSCLVFEIRLSKQTTEQQNNNNNNDDHHKKNNYFEN